MKNNQLNFEAAIQKIKGFDKFCDIHGELWEKALNHSTVLARSKNTKFSCPSVDEANFFVIVLSGVVKVFGSSVQGRDICLKHLAEGDICPLALSGMAGQPFADVRSIAETDLVLLAMPKVYYQELMNNSMEFRQLVMADMAKFTSEMVQTVIQVSFYKLPARVADYLVKASDKYSRDVIPCTHQSIANALGSSREVMSRLLKELETEGLITLQRGAIRVLEKSRLHAMVV